jgi:hypothetical protein
MVARSNDWALFKTRSRPQVHHALAEIIQGGLVLETNINTISQNGSFYSISFFFKLGRRHLTLTLNLPSLSCRFLPLPLPRSSPSIPLTQSF